MDPLGGVPLVYVTAIPSPFMLSPGSSGWHAQPLCVMVHYRQGNGGTWGVAWWFSGNSQFRETSKSRNPGTQEPIIFNQKHVQWKDTYIQKIRFLVKCHADRKTELVTKWYLVCFKETWVGEACEHHKATSMDESLFSTHPKAGNPAFDPLLLKSS